MQTIWQSMGALFQIENFLRTKFMKYFIELFAFNKSMTSFILMFIKAVPCYTIQKDTYTHSSRYTTYHCQFVLKCSSRKTKNLLHSFSWGPFINPWKMSFIYKMEFQLDLKFRWKYIIGNFITSFLISWMNINQ